MTRSASTATIRAAMPAYKLDLEALAARLGSDHGAMDPDLMPLFYCRRCKAEGRPRRRPLMTVHLDYEANQAAKHAAGFGLPKPRSEQQPERPADAPDQSGD